MDTYQENEYRNLFLQLENRRKNNARKLITICVPVLNEASNLNALLERLNTLSETEKDYDFEFLFTDNASTDKTFEILAEKAQSDSRIRVLRFSRNFGFQISILMNYLNAYGDAAVQIDADLQDPPELISSFLRKWEERHKVVYGVRKRLPEFFLKRWSRKAYYRLVRSLSETNIPNDAGDFRLIDRIIIEELRGIKEQTPYLRGIIANLGYAQVGIPYDRVARTAGVSKFNLPALIALGLDGITSQSTKPLRIVTMFGVFISMLAFAGITYHLGAYIFDRNSLPDGFTTLTMIGLTTLGLNSLFIGLVGEYVGRIFNNSRGHFLAQVEHRIEPISDVKAAEAEVENSQKLKEIA